MQELESQPERSSGHRPAGGFGWFAVGSLFGALLLFTTSVLSSRGEVLQLMTNPEDAQGLRMKQIARDAARDGISEVLATMNGAQAVNGPPGPAAAAPVPSGPVNMDVRLSNVQGAATAGVTVIEFSDFQCPYCLRYHTETLPQLINDYVKTGKVKYAFKQFPALGPASVTAAQASECAADQNAFWEYYGALYDFRGKSGRVPQTKDELIKLAAGLNKYDMNRFGACVNQAVTAARVNSDYEDAQRIGGRGTPTFLINGKLVVGAQPYAVFKSAIEEALARKGG